MKCKMITIVLSLGLFSIVNGCYPEVIDQCFKNDECIDGHLCNKENQCIEVEQENLEILVQKLDDAILGKQYSYELSVHGGLPPYTWSIVTGPEWLKVEKNNDTGAWKLIGKPDSYDKDAAAVELSITDDAIGTGQTAISNNLSIRVLYCLEEEEPADVCSGHGNCGDEGLCECSLGYTGNQCGDCDQENGFELNGKGECVKYKYKCEPALACEADVLKCECVGQECEDVVNCEPVFECGENDVCFVNGDNYGCDDCQGTGCTNGACNVCSTGACCDSNGSFEPSSMPCDSWIEHQCSSTTVCGASTQSRDVRRYCDGASSDCSGIQQEDQWVDLEQCDFDFEECESDGNTYAQCNQCSVFFSCSEGSCLSSGGFMLTASDAQAGDQFGNSVSISGDIAIVGAFGEDGGAGSQYPNAGVVYVFEKAADTWSQTTILRATTTSSPMPQDRFGISVSISGDTAIVGALGIYGNTGVAYVFEKTGETWSQKAKLIASDAQAYDGFGISVSIDGDIAIVGAYGEDGGAGSPLSDAGAAYVFQKTGSIWSQKAKLMASDIQANLLFGNSVSISGDMAIVGAYHADVGSGDPISEAGAAYVFEKTGDIWSQTAKLTASDVQAVGEFGNSVSISGDIAIVGAHYEDVGTGDPMDRAGVAYVFQETGGIWSQKAKLTASDAQADDRFGNSVSISGDIAIVGAHFEDGGAGNPISEAGAAYIFRKTGETWSQTAKLTPSEAQAVDWFGWSVSISGDTAIVGASREDGGSGDTMLDAGAAYIF